MTINEINISELLADGTPRYNKLSSGAWVDKTIGRIVAREITSEEASAMAHTRWDTWRNAAASSMLKEAQAIDPSVKTEQDAWGLLYGKQYVAFMDADKPRGKDLVAFGQIVGAMPTIADRTAPQAKEEESLADYAMRGLIAAILEKVEPREIIDGEIK